MSEDVDNLKRVAVAIGLASRDKNVQFVAKHYDRVQDADSMEVKRMLHNQAVAAITAGVGPNSWADADRTVGKGDNVGRIGDWYVENGTNTESNGAFYVFHVRGIDESGQVMMMRSISQKKKHMPGNDVSITLRQTDIKGGYYKKLEKPPF